MASVNKVILIGNLGQAPDVRMTHSNMKVAEISIATTRRFTRNNERVEQTQWHTITLWGKLAEIVEKYTTKGKLDLHRGAPRNRKMAGSERPNPIHNQSDCRIDSTAGQNAAIGEKQWNTKN